MMIKLMEQLLKYWWCHRNDFIKHGYKAGKCLLVYTFVECGFISKLSDKER